MKSDKRNPLKDNGINLIRHNILRTYKLNQNIYLQSLRKSRELYSIKIREFTDELSIMEKIVAKDLREFLKDLNKQNLKYSNIIENNDIYDGKIINPEFECLLKESSKLIPV